MRRFQFWGTATAALAAPVFADVTTSNADTSATSQTITMPATRPDGNLYVLFIVNNLNIGSITVSGWTQEGPAIVSAFANIMMRVFWRIGSSEPATYTATFSSARKCIAAVYRITGGEMERMTINQQETTGSVICPEFTPRRPNTILIRVASSWQSAANDRLTSGPDFNIAAATLGLQLAGHHEAGPAANAASATYAFTQDVGTSQRIAVTVGIAPKETTSQTVVNGRPRNWPQPYSGSTYFNSPATNFTVDAASATLISAFYNNAFPTAGNWNMFDRLFTYPIYFRHNATIQYAVTASAGNMNGQSIWWDPGWEATSGSDAQFIWYDLATGEEINCFQATINHGAHTMSCTRMNRVNTTNSEASLGTIKSFLTGDAGYTPSRGCGLAYGAMLVNPDEVERGCIGHALSCPVLSSKNTFVAPAGKSDGSSGGTIPEGTHFNLISTDATIETAVAALPGDVSAGQRRLARLVYKALRDYGWYVTDTTGSAHLQFEANESALAQWTELGVLPELNPASNGKVYPRDTMDHIFTSTAVFQALAP